MTRIDTLMQRARALPLQSIAIHADLVIEYLDSDVGFAPLEQGAKGSESLFATVLLHGISSAAPSWILQFEAQAHNPNASRLLAWSAPGYGQSTPLTMSQPSADDYAAVLWAWLDALGVQHVHLVGHSLGALMAASAAKQQAGRVVALTLLSPAQGYGAADPALRETKRNDRLQMLARLGISGLSMQRSAAMLRPEPSQEVLNFVMDNMRRQLKPAGYVQATHMLAMADLRVDVLDFQSQSTVLPVVACAAFDKITPPEAVQIFAHNLNLPCVDLGAGGHLCSLELSAAVTELIALPQPAEPQPLVFLNDLPHETMPALAIDLVEADPAFEAAVSEDRGEDVAKEEAPFGEPFQIEPAGHADTAQPSVTVGELAVRFLEACGVQAAFGVISIHNMPMLDAFNSRLDNNPCAIRFVSARGEAGACNMADANARVNGGLGVCVTSTGTGAGNAAGALIEAMTAGTPLLHLTGQIESAYLDRDLGFIHESPNQVALLAAAGKAAYRIRNPETALATLREAVRVAQTLPCGPVSVEIAIDVQKIRLPLPTRMQLQPVAIAPVQPQALMLKALAEVLKTAKRPLLWLGGGARQSVGAAAAAQRLIDLGWGVVTSVQGRGTVAEDHPASLGAFNLQKASQALYTECDAMLVVGSRLRSNETLSYQLQLPHNLYRIDANALAENRAYSSQMFVHGDAALSLNALADALAQHGESAVEDDWQDQVHSARMAAEAQVDRGLAAYAQLKNALNHAVHERLNGQFNWVRDITLSNTMWGNRSLYLTEAKQGVHALGGGIGQGLAMGIGAAINAPHKTLVLCGDGGFMLNVGELACAVQERVNLLVILMNDGGYGVIKNIQDADYGGRHCYVNLHTPNFAQLCASMGAQHLLSSDPAQIEAQLAQALAFDMPTVLEIDMQAWGGFAAKFAGPPRKV
jgi:acetolactate synthase I/II/III large subunit